MKNTLKIKRKKLKLTTLGFTLIELLAVIVILAIIALIAVPIVINIINDAKRSSDEQSVELYKDIVEKTITKKQLSNPSFNPDKCKIQENGNLKCYKNNELFRDEIEVDMKGKMPSDGIVEIKNNKIKFRNILFNSKIYYQKYAVLINDEDGDGKVSLGDKYEYEVNGTDTFNFYVLSFNEEDSTINLIMDRNLNQAVGWHTEENNNNYGPDTAITYLYNITKDWDNVPNMIINYEDENNQNSTEYGYTNIITMNGMTTITGKSTSNITTVGTSSKPLKARLPKESEVNEAGCTTNRASCPIWLMGGLNLTPTFSFCSLCQKKYSQISELTRSYGYWLLSSHLDSNKATIIYSTGCLYYDDTKKLIYGIRPVITVPRSYLEE